MKLRLICHVAVFAALIGAGALIAYRGVIAPTQLGPLEINLETAVMYWFAVLVYGLIALLLYYPLRNRSSSTLILGHGVAVAIALAGTAAVIALGHRHSAPSPDTAIADRITPEVGAPPGQPLALPEPDETTEPQPTPSAPPENRQ
jgi:hypothetical protein